MLENPVTILRLLFPFKGNQPSSKCTFTGLSQKVILQASGRARKRKAWGREPALTGNQSCVRHRCGRGGRASSGQDRGPHLVELTFYRRGTDNEQNEVFRWWCALCRNIKPRREMGVAKGGQARFLREVRGSHENIWEEWSRLPKE